MWPGRGDDIGLWTLSGEAGSGHQVVLETGTVAAAAPTLHLGWAFGGLTQTTAAPRWAGRVLLLG